jgi:hypothetical protein
MLCKCQVSFCCLFPPCKLLGFQILLHLEIQTNQMATARLTSASGILALLDEEQDELKEFALKKLDELVHEFWAEIAASVSKM